MTNTANKKTLGEHPFQVRKTVGRGGAKYVVVQNPGSRRVSVRAHLTAADAQAAADELNIGAMVAEYAVDPRPYDVRLAEAEAA